MRRRSGIIIAPVLAMLGAIIVVTGLAFVVTQTDLVINHNKNTACTADAKLCPDGSYVGRVAPDCKFANCPVTNTNSKTTGTFETGGNTNSTNNGNVNAEVSWKTYTNSTYGFSFRYPGDMTLGESLNDLWQIANVQNGSASMSLAIINGPLNPQNVQGVYGKQDTTTVKVGAQNGYQYNEGDAGCGGPAIQTALKNQKILRIFFTACEEESNLFATDATKRQQILDTFSFTK